MPVVSRFNVWSAVQTWMAAKNRREIKKAPVRDKAFYVGVFDEAQEPDESSETEQFSRKVKM